jgi:hypothetical protein
LHEWIEAQSGWGFAAEHFLESADRVVVLCREWGHGSDSCIRLGSRFAMAWVVERDRIVAMEPASPLISCPLRTIHASIVGSRADDCFARAKLKRGGAPARPGGLPLIRAADRR